VSILQKVLNPIVSSSDLCSRTLVNGDLSAMAHADGCQGRPCPPHRCFLSELTDAVRIQKRNVFRLMGVVVAILPALEPKEDGDENGGTDTTTKTASASPPHVAADPQIVLDDGTGVMVGLTAPVHMIQKVSVGVGKTVECIALHDGASQQLVIDQLFVIKDVHAETLRWAQLAYHRTHRSDHRLHSPPRERFSGCHPSHQWRGKRPLRAVGGGYPPEKFTIEDLYDIICSEAPDDDEEDRKGMAHSSSRLPHQLQRPPRGFNAAELSTLLNVDPARMGSMIEELQMSARVYQDENGRYLPL
jgi:hypothetical protein